jgi:hypothetical protein
VYSPYMCEKGSGHAQLVDHGPECDSVFAYSSRHLVIGITTTDHHHAVRHAATHVERSFCITTNLSGLSPWEKVVRHVIASGLGKKTRGG